MYDFAILGGAFNPIHNGHVYIAKELIRLNVAKQIIFMPNGNHPLKTSHHLLPYEERLALVKLAIKDFPLFSVSTLDSPQYGINYTFHLIQRIKNHYPKASFTFLIGYDNAQNFSLWYEYKWLLENVHFTVVSRNSLNTKTSEIDKRFHLLEIETYDLSSTQIRQMLDKEEDISDLVPSNIITPLLTYWKKLKFASHQ